MNKEKLRQLVESASSLALELVLAQKPGIKPSSKINYEDLHALVHSPPKEMYPQCYTLFSFREPQIHDLLWGLKFRNDPSVATLFAPHLAEAIEHLAKPEPIDRLIPLPLSDTRRKERGYNQSELLALAVQTRLPLLGIDTTLLARRHTKPQTNLNRQARLQNVTGAYSIQPDATVPHQHLLLIDDVITTGASLNEAKRVLQEAGARRVTCLAIAG